MFLSASSIIGKEIDSVLLLISGICIALFAVIIFITLYFVIKYSRERNPNPTDIEGNPPLEIGWTVLSIVLVLFMFYWGWTGYRKIKTEVPKDAFVVKATAQQWLWSFDYENGKHTNVLNLPVNRPVKVTLNSRDVIHGFYIPTFRIKQDVVPGAEKYIWFTPDEEGTYDLFCTQYCGLGHSGMLSKAVVMSGEKFQEWYSGRTEVPKVALAAKSIEVMVEEGKELYRTKGCIACHTIDGTKLVGPSWKGIWGSRVQVISAGEQREVLVDEEYIHRSEFEPQADVVVGYPPVMPPQKGLLTEEEIKAITEYIKTLK